MPELTRKVLVLPPYQNLQVNLNIQVSNTTDVLSMIVLVQAPPVGCGQKHFQQTPKSPTMTI